MYFFIIIIRASLSTDWFESFCDIQCNRNCFAHFRGCFLDSNSKLKIYFEIKLNLMYKIKIGLEILSLSSPNLDICSDEWIWIVSVILLLKFSYCFYVIDVT